MINLKTILLKFASPLQSWGSDSDFETRYTDFYPSKSAVIGLIAGCFGYARDDERISDFNSLDFAVRIDQKGKLLNDYQIAKRYKKKDGSLERTYVTNRYYLEDAVFVVAIGGDDLEIEKISQALKNPYFQPFLGRRSVPPNADFFIGIENHGVIDCLKNLEWQAADWYKKKNNHSLEIYADGNLLEGPVFKYKRDKVVSFSQKNREFGIRPEKRIFIKNGFKNENLLEEHDAFDAFGGNDVSF